MTVIENQNQEIINIAYIIAAGITVIVVVIFVSLFKIDFGIKATNTSANKPLSEITMLPIEKNPHYNWQRSLITTIELLDPTIMSLPSTNFGFSKVRNLEFAKKAGVVSQVDFKIDLTSESQDEPVKINTSPKSLISVFSNAYSQRSSNIDYVKEKMPKIENHVYWTNRDGRVYPSLTQPLSNLKKSAIEPGKINGPTVILMIREKSIIRTQILESSGNDELDKIALRHINKTRVKVQSTGNAKNAILNLKDQLVLYVHWHFLPDSDFSEALKSKDSIHVQDWY